MTVPVTHFDPVEVITYKEPDLERIFTRVQSLGMETIVNSGKHSCDADKRVDSQRHHLERILRARSLPQSGFDRPS